MAGQKSSILKGFGGLFRYGDILLYEHEFDYLP